MPYTSIKFIKLQISLLDDNRFMYKLSEHQQSLYCKLLMLAGAVDNEIELDYVAIRNRLGIRYSIEELKTDILHIVETFRGVRVKNNILYWSNFDELHNYIPGSNRKKARKSAREARQEKPTQQDTTNYDEVLQLWNDFASKCGISQLRSMTSVRRAMVKTRIKEGMNLEEVLAKAEKQDFLYGKNDRGWSMSFDWLFKNDTNYVKVLEGNYPHTGGDSKLEHLL